MAAIPVFATCMYAKDWVPTLGLGLRLGPNIRVLGSGFLLVNVTKRLGKFYREA